MPIWATWTSMLRASMCEEVEAVYAMVVISHNGKCAVAVEVEKDYPGAFYHCGAWYVWERDFPVWKLL